MAIEIRAAAPRDFGRVEAIENEADRLLIEWLRADEWQPAPPAAARANDEGFLLVAEIDSSVLVGFVHVIEAAGLAHVEQLSVSPEYGRNGYGRMLIEAAKTEARSRGYRRVSLRTYADVPWNAPFYARAGFVEERAMTPFHRGLIETETRLGLEKYGRRIQMVAEFQ